MAFNEERDEFIKKSYSLHACILLCADVFAEYRLVVHRSGTHLDLETMDCGSLCERGRSCGIFWMADDHFADATP